MATHNLEFEDKLPIQNSHYNYTYERANKSHAALYIGMWVMQTAVKDFIDLHVPPCYHAQYLLKNGERFASLLRITNSKDMLKKLYRT